MLIDRRAPGYSSRDRQRGERRREDEKSTLDWNASDGSRKANALAPSKSLDVLAAGAEEVWCVSTTMLPVEDQTTECLRSFDTLFLFV